MAEDALENLLAIELDPALLATPCSVETNWHVVTGAACCGKTTLIDLLAEQGFQTLAEIPRQHIEQELAKGRKLEEIFASVDDERAMKEWQQQAERALRAEDVVFLDRALPDFLWFWRLHGLDPNEILEECLDHRYASVFILDQLPYELDGARIENDVFTVLFEDCLFRDYRALGYDVQTLPVMPPEARVELLLETLSEGGLL